MSKKLKMTLGALVIVAAMGYLMITSFSSSAGFQVSISDLVEKGSKFQDDYLLVEGKVLPETVVWDSTNIKVEFVVTDGVNQMPVLFNDVVPDNLDHEDGAEAILRGKYDHDGGIFRADSVETRCPSKYEAAED
ncbi:MAG: cytochrome c maturation protein CcmE [Bacillota bacterium]